jgi:hypothetical protein
MSAPRARLTVFLTSVTLAFVAGSLTVLSIEPRRGVAETRAEAATPAAPASEVDASSSTVDKIYLPQLDPNADLCQG